MLRIDAIHVEDFGPFKGHQTIKLPESDGVVVVYGENMRGKTYLLNAIRFAFFGKVIGRGTRTTSLHKLGNWEQAALGRFGFKVRLDFLYGGSRYQLTRACELRPGVSTPKHDDDYAVRSFLERDGEVLGPQQAEAELKRILPEQISRFFLFDGELLQEYEDLLSSESDMGRRISEAIERILGVPVLTSARTTLLRAKSEAERREALAAQGDLKTREFGNQLADLHAQRKVLQSELDRLEEEIEEQRTRKATLEEAMKKKERVGALLDKRDTLNRFIGDLKKRMATRQEELEPAMTSAWCAVLSSPIHAAMSDLKKRAQVLHKALLRRDVLRSLRADAKSECPACLQAVSEDAQRRIQEALATEGNGSPTEQEEELTSVRRKLAGLEQHANAARSETLRLLWDGVEEVAIDIASKESERDEISKQLENVDEASLRKTKADYEETIREIAAIEKGLDKTRQALKQNESNADQIQKRLERLAGGNLTEERERRQLYSNLHRLLNDGVAAYREQLRKRVQEDATKHFKALTTEPDYSELRINDSYGLAIVHKDGSDIPVRSAGAEHVVALCLVGALQNNAPLRGPIIIDSPFGRLDRGHTRNVVKSLPAMAEQVVLLVYDDELPPQLARSELKGQLIGEWRLERQSARHTELVQRRD